jgi:hypothetical protein
MAPTDQPLGSFAEITDVSLGIFFTDTVWGTNLNLFFATPPPPFTSGFILNNGPNAIFTLSNSAFTGGDSFSQAMVIDTATREIISGPEGIVVVPPFPIPEPRAIALFGVGVIGLALARRRSLRARTGIARV